MDYVGKLYGKIDDKRFFYTGKTGKDWDELELKVKELESQLQALESKNSIEVKSNWIKCGICGFPLSEHSKESKLCPDRLKHFSSK